MVKLTSTCHSCTNTPNSSLLAFLVCSTSSQHILLNSLSAILLGEPMSQFEFSIQANVFSLSEPDLPTGSLDFIEIAEIQILD